MDKLFRSVRFWAVLAIWVATLALPLSACSADAENAVLVSSGKAVGRIVTSANPSKAEVFVAEELQTYIKKITGAKLPIEKTDTLTPSQVATIIVGNHPLAKEVTAELTKRYPRKTDAIAVVAKGKLLFLTGKTRIAIAYAAWDWLEKDLGVRWFFPTEKGEYIPHCKDLSIKPVERYEAPRVDIRNAHTWGAPGQTGPKFYGKKEHGYKAGNLHNLRRRMNGRVAGVGKQYDWGNLRDWQKTSIGHGHSYGLMMSVSKWGKKHPLWFNKIKGKQPPSREWQPNWTNREVAKKFASILASLAKKRLAAGLSEEEILFWASPRDTRAWCECEDCQKLVDEDGSATSMVFNLANMVAEELHKTHPRARVYCLAYYNYGKAPTKIKLASGVIPVISHWPNNQQLGYDHSKPGFSDENAKYREHWKKWSQMADGVMPHAYYCHYIFPIFPQTTQIATDFPIMGRDPKYCGVRGEFRGNYGTQGLTMYLLAKLIWNPNIDVEKTVVDYCDKAFGPASKDMQRYYSILQDRMDKVKMVISGGAWQIPRLLTPEVVRQCNAVMKDVESCLSLDKMDENTRWRTTLAIKGWKISAAICEATYLRFSTKQPGPKDRQRILSLCDEAQAIVDSDWGTFAFDIRVPNRGISVAKGALNIPLNSLPPGENVFNDRLSFNGVTKCFGKIKGFGQSGYGAILSAGQTGVIELPVGAAEGHKIVSMALKMTSSKSKDLKIKLLIKSKSGKKQVAVSGEELLAGKFGNIAKGMLNCQKVILSMEFADTRSSLRLISVNLKVKVE